MTYHRKKIIPKNDVGILGAGIMGCCLALELAQRGISVDLLDLAVEPMTGASLHNEGKLHLGFVYGNDPLKETHKLMLRGSMTFTPILQKLTGCDVKALRPSLPFHYFIPTSSQLNIEEIEAHFKAVEQFAIELTNNSNGNYLGLNILSYFNRNKPFDHERLFSKEMTLGSFQTEERSVSTTAVSQILSKAVNEHPLINFIKKNQVMGVERKSKGSVTVESLGDNKSEIREYQCVANCLWDDKLRVDATAGIDDDGPWILRYKATIGIKCKKLNGQIPSATGILGSYGDIVNHNDGNYYVSWYPLCKRAQSTGNDGRKLHDLVHKGSLSHFVKMMKAFSPQLAKTLSSFTHRRFLRKNVEEMSTFIPAMRKLMTDKTGFELGGGVILARGNTDIDDPNSFLHQRSVVGPVAYGSYVTIDTGKYCTAPLFAIEAADIISDIL